MPAQTSERCSPPLTDPQLPTLQNDSSENLLAGDEETRSREGRRTSIGEILGNLADQSRAVSVTQPIGRQQADRTVRLLNQTVSRLRRLPEIMEEMTKPI
ncbi:hypothetical protein ACFY1L_05910 [Streptomyces sp. NPDC001663]|uniref:hypothetical protein n=1 Tax=Streptomyces sp. NPDC001663 TaxID=3364597 RepID=UPI0036A3561E